MILRDFGCPPTEYSTAFFEYMVKSMEVSFYKYGAIADGFPDKLDAMASLRQRILDYARTGNMDYLIDIANFAMIEWMHPKHEEAHYEPGDSDTSPGRTTPSGVVTHRSNSDISD
jgi:hypothetical protein